MSIPPEGEALRKAVKYISDEKRIAPEAPLMRLIEKAGLKFDLSPVDMEFLINFYNRSEK